VAGFGKVLNYGTQIIGGFANQTVFNLVGANPRQPTVSSFLPLTIAQPLLQGGGRAVTLEALTQAERTLVYEVRNFARFRQQFIPYIIGVQQQVDNEGIVTDPNVGYLFVVQQLQDIENDRFTLDAYRNFFEKFRNSIGGGSGISQLQVDQVEQSLQGQVNTLITDTVQYRNALDQYKYQIGLPPDVPMILDRSPIDPIRKVFFEIDAWSRKEDKDRENADLDVFVAKLPRLEDVVIDGRAVVDLYSDVNRVEEVNLACERVALEHRFDLMNQRATLYDVWRQLAFQANSLKGIVNVTLTNQFLTPPNTTNPAAFIENSKQFSLVLSTELPLIRVSQRNAYRLAIINYRRQQRALMAFEDNLKYNIRTEVRNLVQFAQQYEIQRRLLLLALRRKDNAQRQINAPPQGANVDTSALVNTNTTNLLAAQAGILTAQNTLIGLWVNYETARMILYRDLGIMPYDEWEAYYEFFAPKSADAGGLARADERPPADRSARVASAPAGPGS
jgi:hypothetical protein